jgi:RNA polymerase sigma-70 factor (ECF subfamily)
LVNSIKRLLIIKNVDEQKNFKSYIFEIAKNMAIDKFRKLSKKTHSPIEDIYFSDKDPEKDLLDNEKHQLLQEALSPLPPQQKEIYRLRYEQKKKVKLKGIAQKMNISVSAVQNAINKANKKIKEYFAKKNIFEVVFFHVHTYCIYTLNPHESRK